MKTNQPDPEPDMDGVERTRLASIGVLVGLLIVGCLVLVLTLSANPGARTPTVPEVKSETRPSFEIKDDAASAAQQRATVVPTTETPKSAGIKPEAGRKRAGSASSTRVLKREKPYVISVAPGRTPRMTQVQ